MTPNPLEILTLAMVRASARGDDKAVAKLAKFGDDPEKLVAALGDDDLTASFADWHPGTSKATGEQGFVSTGGQFRRQKPASSDVQTEQPTHALPDGVDLSEIASLPEVKANPSILTKVKSATATAVQYAKRAVLEVSYYTPQILGAWTDVFDHPDDLKKIGYNPSFGGNSAHQTTDPVKEHLGIPAHMAAGLVVKIGGAAIAFLKKKLAGTQKMADPGDDGLTALSELLAEVLNGASKAFGIDYTITPDQVATNLKALRAEKESAAGKA